MHVDAITYANGMNQTLEIWYENDNWIITET